MNSCDALKLAIEGGNMVCTPYLADLSDEEMMLRPHPNCNHIKWQLGHLIASEHQMMDSAIPGSMPPLPDGFAEKYSKEAAASDDPSAFDSKAELMRVHAEQRAATLAALDGLSDADLDKPTPEAMQQYAPTIGAAFAMQCTHWLMHSGQWVIVRRATGREPLF
jgi:hypothetical protein